MCVNPLSLPSSHTTQNFSCIHKGLLDAQSQKTCNCLLYLSHEAEETLSVLKTVCGVNEFCCCCCWRM